MVNNELPCVAADREWLQPVISGGSRNLGRGVPSIKNARKFLMPRPFFVMTTPTRDRKWRVLCSLLGSRASNRPEFVHKYL